VENQPTNNDNAALLPLEPQRLNRNPEQVLQEAHEAAAALKRVIDSKPEAITFNGKTYLTFEDWQTLGYFYGITARVKASRSTKVRGVDGFLAAAEAIDSNGRVISEAHAMCMRDEKNWNSRPEYMYDERGKRHRVGDVAVPMFQLRSMAQTRACAKSLRNVLAWVVVLAGYEPTPAEDLYGPPDAQEGNGPRRVNGGDAGTNQALPLALCYDCGGELWNANEILASKRKYNKSLCAICIKRERDRRANALIAERQQQFDQAAAEPGRKIPESVADLLQQQRERRQKEA
jgi:hypothetical protein